MAQLTVEETISIGWEDGFVCAFWRNRETNDQNLRLEESVKGNGGVEAIKGEIEGNAECGGIGISTNDNNLLNWFSGIGKDEDFRSDIMECVAVDEEVEEDIIGESNKENAYVTGSNEIGEDRDGIESVEVITKFLMQEFRT